MDLWLVEASHKVYQNFGCRTPQPEFFGYLDTHNTHSGCATATECICKSSTWFSPLLMMCTTSCRPT